jgi:ATP-binding cassette subfamily B (MDR/TAP) protein 1
VLQVGVSEKLAISIQFSVLIVTAYVIAFKYSWQLTLASSSVLLFVSVVYGILIPLFVKLQKNMEHAEGKATTVASEALGAIRMIKACGAEERMSSKFGGWVQETKRRGLKMSPATAMQMSPVFFAIYANFALTFWFGVRLYSQHHISSVATVVTCVYILSLVLGTTTDLFQGIYVSNDGGNGNG